MSQVALITGAAQGLGQIIAQAFLDAGYKVVVTDASEVRARSGASGLVGDPGQLLALKLDVTSKADFEAALAAAEGHWGGVQVLVNNAALTPTTPVMQITADEFDRVIGINQRGTFFGCQVFGAAFARAGYGRIVNLASLAGQNGGTASGAHYASSKAAIIALTKIFARELGPSNVTVNAIAPGPMELPSVRAAVPAERLAAIIETIPVKRLGNPRFVANLAVQLASPDADFTTGATWDVNGGIFMR